MKPVPSIVVVVIALIGLIAPSGAADYDLVINNGR